MRVELPVANGLRTDHPVPGLPFVDDRHLPIEDGEAIQACGRHERNSGWGRVDYDASDRRRWMAFTSEQSNLRYGWVVQEDPDHGRSVLLYEIDDAIIMHDTPHPECPRMWRAGGYWWNGQQWHRPPVIFDAALEEAIPVPVPDATTVDAARYLAAHLGTPSRGRVEQVTDFKPRMVSETQWAHDLAYWATCRPDDGLPLEWCVVDLEAPELERSALVSRWGAARLLGMSLEEVDNARHASGFERAERFPWPQRYTRRQQPRWAKPVLLEWARERQRANPESVVEHLQCGATLPPGNSLVHTISSAVLQEMRDSHTPGRTRGCSLGVPLERTLCWIVVEHPRLAEQLFGDIVRRARQAGFADHTTIHTLRDAVFSGATEREALALHEFLNLTLPPSAL